MGARTGCKIGIAVSSLHSHAYIDAFHFTGKKPVAWTAVDDIWSLSCLRRLGTTAWYGGLVGKGREGILAKDMSRHGMAWHGIMAQLDTWVSIQTK